VQTLLIEELVADRIGEARRRADRARRAAGAAGPPLAVRAAARSLDAFGFWLVRTGLRLASAGAGRRLQRQDAVCSG
jgi:hypothetical protein